MYCVSHTLGKNILIYFVFSLLFRIGYEFRIVASWCPRHTRYAPPRNWKISSTRLQSISDDSHPHVRNRRLDKCHQTHASDTRRMPKKLPKLGSIAREVIFRFSGSRLRECSRSTEHRDDGVSQTFLETLIVATIGPCITICSSAAHRLDDYS